eukprot:scaffold339125_cov18-Prasinocladus_malaysianus.AAC.1
MKQSSLERTEEKDGVLAVISHIRALGYPVNEAPTRINEFESARADCTRAGVAGGTVGGADGAAWPFGEESLHPSVEPVGSSFPFPAVADALRVVEACLACPDGIAGAECVKPDIFGEKTKKHISFCHRFPAERPQ